ncbi:MAG: hypothetical protein VST68_08400 [Nitrospirota bacterium]|nr:hypothetical protein [Nitrospirota bacterium]
MHNFPNNELLEQKYFRHSLKSRCGGESPESLFGTVQFEEQQTNFAHAKVLYQQIIREHPDSEWAKQARERLEALK